MKKFSFVVGMTFAALSAAGVLNAASNLSSLRVFPNPVRPSTGVNTVTFDNLTDQAKIIISDLNGHSVREVTLENSGSQFLWDLKNGVGDTVASGVYFYVVGNNAGEKRRGKIAVIR